MNTFLMASLMVLQSATGATAPTTSGESDIAVLTAQIATWKGGLGKKDDGTVGCVTRTSSGDAMLDAIQCGATLTCTMPLVQQLDTIMASDMAREEKSAKATELLQSTLPCLEEYRTRGVARLAESRAAG